MSVTEAESLTAIKPLTNGNHDTDSIVQDGHGMSILSKDTQELKATLGEASNDTLADDLIAKPVELDSEGSQHQTSDVAKPTSNSHNESHVEHSHSIVDGATVANISQADESILISSAESVPPNIEHQELPTRAQHLDEPLQRAATVELSTLTTKLVSPGAEEKPIDAIYNTSGEFPVPTIDVDKESESSMAADETPVLAEETAPTSGVVPAVAEPGHNVALTDPTTDHPVEVVSSVKADGVATDEAPLILEKITASLAAQHSVALAVAEELVPSDAVEVCADVSHAVAKEEEEDKASTTSHAAEMIKPSPAVEVSVEASRYAAEHVAETVPAASGEAVNLESSLEEAETCAEPSAKEDTAPITADPTAEHVTEADGDVSTTLHQSATSPETTVGDEVPSNDEQVEPKDTHDSHPVVSSDLVIESISQVDDILTEPEALAIGASAPNSDDAIINEEIAEPTEAHGTDHVESSTVAAVSATGEETIDDAAAVNEPPEPPTTTQDIASPEAAEGEPVSGTETVESAESSPTFVEELSVPVLEAADVDDAAVHTHPEEAAALDLTDADPLVRPLQTDEPSEQPALIGHAAHDALPVTKGELTESADPVVGGISTSPEPGEDVTPSVIPQALQGAESTHVESVLVEEKPEEIRHVEVTAHVEEHDAEQETVEEAGTQESATGAKEVPAEQDEHLREQLVAAVDSDLTSKEARPFEAATIPEVVEQEIAVETNAEQAPVDDQTPVNLSAPEESDPSEEAPAPASEFAIEQGAPAFTETIGTALQPGVAEETVTAIEPGHIQETPAHEMDSVQGNTEAAVGAHAELLISVNEATLLQPSSEHTEPVDQIHPDAKAVDELSAHEVRQPVKVEMPAVDIGSAILAESPVKEELVPAESERVVEESVAELQSTGFADEISRGTGPVEEAVQEASLSIEDGPVLEVSNETLPNQDIVDETKVVEETPSTLEGHPKEDTSGSDEASTPSVEPPVHKDGSQPATEPSAQEEPPTGDQQIIENTSPAAPLLDKEISELPVEAAKELDGTPATAVPLEQVAILEEEHILPAVAENDVTLVIESQQLPVEQNELEKSPDAQEAPMAAVDEVTTTPLPSVAESTSPGGSGNHEMDVVGEIDDPITTVADTHIESGADPIIVGEASLPEADMLKTPETEVERPKSPWMPSFQVTTVGRGVASSADDEQPASQGSGEPPIADDTVDKLQVVTPAIVADQAVNNAEVDCVSPQLLVKTSSLDTSAEPARPWTPSYSVHSQGSPPHSPAVLEQEDPIVLRGAGDRGPEVNVFELPEVKFAGNETFVSNQHGLSEAPAARHLDSAAMPPAGTNNADVAVVGDVLPKTDWEEQVVGPERPTERPEISGEADTAPLVEETRDVSLELKGVSQIPKLVLDDHTETPARAEGGDGALPGPPESLPEQLSPSSWVPSYSVSRQGSPLQGNASLPEEEELDIPDRDDIIPVDKSLEPLADTQVSPEDPGKAEQHMPSQDITNRTEPAILLASVQDSAVGDANCTVQGDNTVLEVDHMGVVGGDGNGAQVDKEPPPSTAVDDPADQPKTPWTPSYSVTVQGIADGQQLEVEPLDRYVNEEIHQDANTNRPDTPDIRQPEKAVAQSEERLEDISEHTRPVPSNAEANIHSTDLAPQKSDPPVGDGIEMERASKPEVPRLEPVSNAAKVGAESSPPTTRKRHGSTASRFSPGGWFSTPPKAVDEGRTSLEIAQGEFAFSKPTSPAEDVLDSSEPEHESSSDDDDEAEEEEEEKRRWCVVM